MNHILVYLILSFFLQGCTKAPLQTTDACSILKQNNGFFFNWGKSLKDAEKKYGIPIPIIMATVYVESGFQQNARPLKKRLFGFIPWEYLSSAYGYSQAINSTWDAYRMQTGNKNAYRNNFSDSIHFIAWYHRESVRKNNISPYNAYELYLSYYMGHSAYNKHKINIIAIYGAQKMQEIAKIYNLQLIKCKF